MWSVSVEASSTLIIGADSLTLLQRLADGRVEVLAQRSLAGATLADLATRLQEFTLQAAHCVPTGLVGGLRVYCSDRWLLWLSLPWSPDLLSRASARAVYELHVTATYGYEGSELLYEAQYAPPEAPHCVAGLPSDVMRAVEECAGSCGERLVSLRPLSVAAWERSRASVGDQRCHFAVVEGDTITLLLARARFVERVTLLRFAGDPVAAVSNAVRRLRLQEPALGQVTHVQVLNLLDRALVSAAPEIVVLEQSAEAGVRRLAAPATAPGEFDFASRPMPARGWRLAVLAAGIAMAGFFAWRALSLFEHRAELTSEVAAAYEVPRAVVTTSPARLQQERMQIRAANRAIASLNVPIGRLLRAVQPAADARTALLGLDVADMRSDTATAAVKISAESRSGSDMTRYVDDLARSQAFESVYLVRHEVVDGSGRPYRFVVEASWPQ